MSADRFLMSTAYAYNYFKLCGALVVDRGDN